MKKIIYCFALGLLAVFAFSAFNGGYKKRAESDMFRGDLLHSGIYASRPITKTPSIQWKFKTGGPINSSAAIANERIYFGSGDSCLYCLDLQSGKQVWKYKTGGAVQSSPAVSNGMVYFGSYDGHFYALDDNDGNLLWQFKTDGEKPFSAYGIHGRRPKDSLFVDDWDFYLSSPAVDAGIVYFGTGSGFVYALNAYTGKQEWKFRTGNVVHCSPAVAYGNIYIGSWDTWLYALDKKTGTEQWKFKTGIDTAIYNQTGIQGSPLIQDSVLYFGCRDSYIYALNAINGKKIWQKYNGTDWVISTPVISGNKIIYGTGAGRNLVALNKETGDSIYQVQNKGYIHSSISVAGEYVYFGELTGFITCSDIETGKRIWSYQLDGSKKDQYKILYPDGSLNEDAVFNSEKRKKEGKNSLEMIFTLGSVVASPALKNEILFVGSTDGYFYALK